METRRPIRKSEKDVPELLLAFKWEGQDPTGWWMSEKLDGVRAFWNGTKFVSRLGNEFMAPDWFVAGLPADMTLDGELWGGRGQFQSTVSVVKTAKSPQWPTIRYKVFDAPGIKAPFEQRMAALQDCFDKNSPKYATVVPQTLCKGNAHLQEELKKVHQYMIFFSFAADN